MEPRLLETFIDDLVEMKILHCVECHDILMSPVMLVEGTGNLCNPCYKDFKTENTWLLATENDVLDKLLAKLDFPCKYKTEGCGQRLPYSDYHLHVNLCTHKKISCLSTSSECKWSGRMKDAAYHLRDEHPESVLTSDSGVFVISCDNGSNDLTNILRTWYGTFLLCLNISESNINFIIYDVDKTAENLDYKVEYSGNCGLKILNECPVVKDTKIIEDFKRYSTSNLNTKLPEERDIQIKITFNKDDKDFIMNSSMIQHLECPICNEYMKPPIYQCETGHDICKSCKAKLRRCPLCRGPYGETRNYAVERMAEKILCPCKFETEGCIIKSPVTKNHEVNCSYRKWGCPLSRCTFSAPYTQLLAHAKNTWPQEYFWNSISFSEIWDKTCYGFIIYHDIFFIVGYRFYNGHCMWFINNYGPRKDTTYSFRVTVNSGARSLSATGLYTTKENSFLGSWKKYMTLVDACDISKNKLDNFERTVVVKCSSDVIKFLATGDDIIEHSFRLQTIS